MFCHLRGSFDLALLVAQFPRGPGHLLEAEHNFRKIVGYRALAELDAALRAHAAVLDRGLDNRTQGA